MKELLTELEKLQVEALENRHRAHVALEIQAASFENGRHAAFTEVIHLVKRMSTSDEDYRKAIDKISGETDP